MDVLGVLIAIAFIVFACYKQINVIVVALLASAIVMITSQMNFWDAYAVQFAGGLVRFIGAYYFIFILGSIFGQFAGDSGSASAIAHKLHAICGDKYALVAIAIATAILTYGGISVFVIVFTVVPLGMALIKKVNLPKRCIVGCLCLGAGSFTMTALPGSPALNNLIPTTFLGTTPLAAPLMGFIATAIMLIGGIAYILWDEKKVRAAGIGYDGADINSSEAEAELPSWTVAMLPIVSLVGIIYYLNSTTFSPDLPAPMFAKGKMASLCSVSIALIAATLITWGLNFKKIKNPWATLSKGAGNAVAPIFNTGVLVGFGAVIQAASVFKKFVAFALGLDLNPYLKVVIAVNILAGITASSSGGLTIFMNAVAKDFLALGINPEAFHRLAAISSGGLDSLPQSGSVLTILAVIGTNHKDAYHYLGWICTVIPIIAAFVCAALANALY